MNDADRLTHLIVEFYEKLSSWEHCVVRGKGLTLPQMHTIEILGAHGPMRMKELAEKMGVTTGTLTMQVDRLESRGLARRMPHERDRRSWLVELSEKGRSYFEEHDKLHQRLTLELTEALSNEERAAVLSALEKMNKRF
ncbi:MarR family winged helix-turn-helix transcriptional regulator [Desulfovibrio sp. X2]|uniref:MarR family winged helix-turn-helix transcriptional regulator n=1 Tax=Desulfovibrio sp. X2 TaxID=941449 RepID=UPI000558F5B2|nr:MarR family transcriptional regulator [Desulfovibrio sp. X2]